MRESVLAHSTETRRTTLSYVALNALRHRQGFRIWDFGILRTSGVTCEGAGALAREQVLKWRRLTIQLASIGFVRLANVR